MYHLCFEAMAIGFSTRLLYMNHICMKYIRIYIYNYIHMPSSHIRVHLYYDIFNVKNYNIDSK